MTHFTGWHSAVDPELYEKRNRAMLEDPTNDHFVQTTVSILRYLVDWDFDVDVEKKAITNGIVDLPLDMLVDLFMIAGLNPFECVYEFVKSEMERVNGRSVMGGEVPPADGC